MDNACDALEREFKRINNDLEFVGHRFEAEFRSRCATVFQLLHVWIMLL